MLAICAPPLSKCHPNSFCDRKRYFGVLCDPSLAPATPPTALFPPDLAEPRPPTETEGIPQAEGKGGDGEGAKVQGPHPPRRRPMARCRVHCADALEFVAGAAGKDLSGCFDAILLDVYTAGQFPAPLLQPAFFSGLQASEGVSRRSHTVHTVHTVSPLEGGRARSLT